MHITLDMAISEWKYQLIDNEVVRRRDKQGPGNNMAIRGGNINSILMRVVMTQAKLGPGTVRERNMLDITH